MKAILHPVLPLAIVAASLLICWPTLTSGAQERGQGVRKNVAGAEPRIALVIGNSAYAQGPLANPVNDARDIAVTLRQLGFEVSIGENCNRRQMEDLIREFGWKIRKGGVGMFYFAGHGVQVGGANYLVPVGAVINSEAEVKYEAVDAGFVLAQMEEAQNRILAQVEEARNRLNIVILDACRDNPFARSFRSSSRGLASIDAPIGTLIAYATSPGRTASDGRGRNGLYTKELLAAMRVPGLKLEDVFKRVRSEVRRQSNNQQIPWEASSIEGDFYFSTPGVEPASTPAFSPSKFYFEYKGEPEPGRRTWRQMDPTTWIEQYPSGHETVFIVTGRAAIKGNKGFVVHKVAGDVNKTLVTDNTFEVFIPDRNAEELRAMFRHYVNGSWLEWQYLAEVTYFQ